MFLEDFLVSTDKHIKEENWVDQVEPEQAYRTLVQNKKSYLVDVRSAAEWNFVGIPDCKDFKNEVLLFEWATYPGMVTRKNFSEELSKEIDLDGAEKIYFLCRSGVRSLLAAKDVSSFLKLNSENDDPSRVCVNIRYGFEGDLIDSHRGVANGWKKSGLPWKQF